MKNVDILGSSRSLTSKIPLSISSHLPFLPRSSLDTRAWLRLPSAAALRARSRSRALAARIASLDSVRAAWMASRASLRAEAGRVARAKDAVFAAMAAASGEALVSDMAEDAMLVMMEDEAMEWTRKQPINEAPFQRRVEGGGCCRVPFSLMTQGLMMIERATG